MSNDQQLQLQLWDGKRYVPVPDGTPRGRSWRICKPDREQPSRTKWRPSKYCGCQRSRDTVIADYLAWAKARGLTHITVWSDVPTFAGVVYQKGASASYPYRYEGFTVTTVTKEEFFAVTEETIPESFADLIAEAA